MERNVVETLMGAVVLVVAVFFAFFAYKSSNYHSSSSTYALQARFDSVDGIGVGSDIRIGGIKVGVVDSMVLDMETYLAVTTISLDEKVKLPSDSSAAVVSEGLLGGRYIALTPGGDENLLNNGDEIAYTQSAVNIESLIGRFMFNGGLEEDAAATEAEPAYDPFGGFGLEDDLESASDDALEEEPDDSTDEKQDAAESEKDA